jgi:hypothetical protein
MHRKLPLAAAAALVAASLLPASANAAPYQVLRWKGITMCQVWDHGISRPIGGFTAMSKPTKSFNAAMKTRNALVAKRKCAF